MKKNHDDSLTSLSLSVSLSLSLSPWSEDFQQPSVHTHTLSLSLSLFQMCNTGDDARQGFAFDSALTDFSVTCNLLIVNKLLAHARALFHPHAPQHCTV